MKKPVEITVAFLCAQIERARMCDNATIPTEHFSALLAMAAKAPSRVRRPMLTPAPNDDGVNLPGDQLRALLAVALVAKELEAG